MWIEEKKHQLQMIIKEQLSPLIDNDYIFIDLPYYNNIGDVLIWEGTERYLKTISHRCLYKTSFNNFVHKKISKDTVILMQGGGNFGDIWHEHQNFRKQIIKEYPENRIIILPQTIYYQNEDNLKKDAEEFSHHNNIFICARDRHSYDVFNKYFSAYILLLPDMAFFIDLPLKKHRTNRVLYLKRKDKEQNLAQMKVEIPVNVEIHDWPTYERNFNVDRVLFYSSKLLSKLNNNWCRLWRDYYEDKIIRGSKLSIGCRFLSNYDLIYSTRLHVAILGSLMGIQVKFIDNSYGKNKNFYDTWLKDLDTISMIDKL